MGRLTYLNNAATSFPKPERVTRAVTALLQRPPFHHARTGLSEEGTDVVDEARRRLADLFGVGQPARICFSSGATESLNLALWGLPLDRRNVVTTAAEHNSVLRPLKTMERQGRISLSVVACDRDGRVVPDELIRTIGADTGAVVVNHCSNVTGIVNDIGTVGAETRARGISFIVDASQSAGVWPIDVARMHIDVLVFAGHKALFGLPGVGGAYLGDRVEPRPLKVGGTGVRSDYLYQPDSLPMRYEAGTQNISGIVSLGAGVAFVLETGPSTIQTRKVDLVERMREPFLDDDRVTLYPDPACPSPTTLFSFNVRGVPPADVEYILRHQFDIVTRSGLHCAPLIHEYIGTWPDGSVRVSPSFLTRDAEADAFVEALKSIVLMGDRRA